MAGTKNANGGVTSTGGNAGNDAMITAGVDASTGAAAPVTISGGEAGVGGEAGMWGDAGSSGEAGAPVTCEGAPIPLKGSWRASASHSFLGTGELDSKPEYVTDLTMKRWTTGKAQAGDEWLQVDFSASAAIRELRFTVNPDDVDDFPRKYQINLSDTPLDFDGAVRASGAGAIGETWVVTLAAPVRGRYLLVQQKGKDPVAWWSVAELTAECF